MDILYQLIGTEVVTVRAYVNLGVGMYLMFVVAIGTRDFIYLFCPCFPLLLHRSPVNVMVRCRRGNSI